MLNEAFDDEGFKVIPRDFSAGDLLVIGGPIQRWGRISDLLASLANQGSRRRQGSSVRHPSHACTLLSGTAGPDAIWLTEPVLCAGASALSAFRIVARSTSSWDRAPTTAGM